MKYLPILCAGLVLTIASQPCLLAQDASLAPADMDFTRKIIAHYHFVAWVSLELTEGRFTSYQYDRYPDTATRAQVERIKSDEGVFARMKDKSWLKSDDWAETGTPEEEQ